MINRQLANEVESRFVQYVEIDRLAENAASEIRIDHTWRKIKGKTDSDTMGIREGNYEKRLKKGKKCE